MILADVVFSDNLHLTGRESAPLVDFSSRPLLGGNKVLQVDPANRKPRMEIIARHDGASKMGTFCQKDLEELRANPDVQAGRSVPLIHVAGNFTVKVLAIEVEQSDEKEAPGPYKKFHGKIVVEEI